MMRNFLSECQQQFAAPIGQSTQIVHGMRLNSVTNKLIQKIESMSGQFSAALSQSRLMQTYALTDRRQYEVLLSPVFRMEHSFENLQNIYLRILRPIYGARHLLADAHGRSWLEVRPGLGREAHLAWPDYGVNLTRLRS